MHNPNGKQQQWVVWEWLLRLQIIVKGWRNKTRSRRAVTLKQTSAFMELHHITLYTKTQGVLLLLLQQCSYPPKDSQYRSLCSVSTPPSVRAASISVVSPLLLAQREDSSYKHLLYFLSSASVWFLQPRQLHCTSTATKRIWWWWLVCLFT